MACLGMAVRSTRRYIMQCTSYMSRAAFVIHDSRTCGMPRRSGEAGRRAHPGLNVAPRIQGGRNLSAVEFGFQRLSVAELRRGLVPAAWSPFTDVLLGG